MKNIFLVSMLFISADMVACDQISSFLLTHKSKAPFYTCAGCLASTTIYTGGILASCCPEPTSTRVSVSDINEIFSARPVNYLLSQIQTCSECAPTLGLACCALSTAYFCATECAECINDCNDHPNDKKN
jgi:hypothetical protein